MKSLLMCRMTASIPPIPLHILNNNTVNHTLLDVFVYHYNSNTVSCGFFDTIYRWQLSRPDNLKQITLTSQGKLSLSSHVTFHFMIAHTVWLACRSKNNDFCTVSLSNGERIHSSLGPKKGLIHGTRTLLRVSLARLLLHLTSSLFRFNQLRHSGPSTHTPLMSKWTGRVNVRVSTVSIFFNKDKCTV